MRRGDAVGTGTKVQLAWSVSRMHNLLVRDYETSGKRMTFCLRRAGITDGAPPHPHVHRNAPGPGRQDQTGKVFVCPMR